MIKAFYTGISGAQASQNNLNVVSNNLANVGTEGFKKSKAEFSDLLHNNIRGASTGSGSKINKVDVVFSQGAAFATGSDTDFAITGDGFFGVQFENEEELLFTRSGSFDIINTDDGRYLMCNGGYVVNSEEEPINIDELEDDELILPGVFKFAVNEDLVQSGNNMYRIGNENTEYMISEEDQLLRGYLESSTVDLAEEMVNIIESQRAFQLNSNIIKTADEIEQTINSLKS